MTTDDNIHRLTRIPRSIQQMFPAASVCAVLGSDNHGQERHPGEGDAWIIANADGLRLAITGRGQFIHLDERSAERLISALTEALNMHKLRVRSLPVPRPGRPRLEETMPDVHARCLELAADGESSKSIHYRLIQEFGKDNVPKGSRTVRRWLEKVRATEEVHE